MMQFFHIILYTINAKVCEYLLLLQMDGKILIKFRIEVGVTVDKHISLFY